MMNKADQLFALAQALADEHPFFFEIKGPSIGDHNTADFMKNLRARAAQAFETDFAEKKICGANNLCVDYYFKAEETVVEVALGLRNPTSEFERDILKAIMAKEYGNSVSHLFFISKPGAKKRLGQPGSRAIVDWARRVHGIDIKVCELARIQAS
jgi:O6-methylguanine-DNA--protein-cysteine methyltransferase